MPAFAAVARLSAGQRCDLDKISHAIVPAVTTAVAVVQPAREQNSRLHFVKIPLPMKLQDKSVDFISEPAMVRCDRVLRVEADLAAVHTHVIQRMRHIRFK